MAIIHDFLTNNLFSPVWAIWKGVNDVERLKTMVTIVTSAGALVTFVFAYIGIQQSFKKQITDRFTSAINQLKSDDTAIKLGGIYALEVIAKESKEYHWTIMEILCAFVRYQSLKWKESIEVKAQELSNWYEAEKSLPVPIDIQSALTVIGRRNTNYEAKNRSLELTKSYLPKVDFRGFNFRGIHFSESILSHADFSEADLTKAQLDDAHLESAILKSAILSEARFNKSNLSSADLTNCIAKEAFFTDAIHL